MSDEQFFDAFFTPEERDAYMAIAIAEAVALAEKDRAIIGSEYVFTGVKKSA